MENIFFVFKKSQDFLQFIGDVFFQASDFFHIILRKFLQDEIVGVQPTADGSAGNFFSNADADPSEFLRSQSVNDILNPVVSS